MLRHASYDRLGGYGRESLLAEVRSQRLQNELSKIVNRTTFNIHQLVPARNGLAAAPNWVSTPAKNCAQFECKNLIGLIVGATSLPRFLNSSVSSACGLRNIRLCRFFNFARNSRKLVSPYVPPMRPGGL